MGRHPSVMVPIALLLVLPLVAATGHDMQDMMKMMEMMEMMNKMKGWGDKSMEMGSMEDSKEEDSREMMGGQQGGEWFNMQNREDYEAYLKWCEENRARNAEFQEQQEAKEKKQNMMAEWKQWEKQMEMVASFDKLGYEIMEMKGKYYYTVTFEFMKFCKCSDFAGKVEAFFMGEPSNSDKFEMEMFEDLVDTIEDAQQRGDPNSIAQVLVNMSKGDQIKASTL